MCVFTNSEPELDSGLERGRLIRQTNTPAEVKQLTLLLVQTASIRSCYRNHLPPYAADGIIICKENTKIISF